MILVTVDVILNDNIDPELQAALHYVDTKSAKEPGCLKHVTSVDVGDPRRIQILGLWESLQVLKPHFQTAHMVEIQKSLGKQRVHSLKSRVFDVEKEVLFPN